MSDLNIFIIMVFIFISERVGSGRGQDHRDMMNTVAEMKKRLPSDKRSRSKASTVEALNYALNCVKQVQGNRRNQKYVKDFTSFFKPLWSFI